MTAANFFAGDGTCLNIQCSSIKDNVSEAYESELSAVHTSVGAQNGDNEENNF